MGQEEGDRLREKWGQKDGEKERKTEGKNDTDN